MQLEPFWRYERAPTCHSQCNMEPHVPDQLSMSTVDEIRTLAEMPGTRGNFEAVSSADSGLERCFAATFRRSLWMSFSSSIQIPLLPLSVEKSDHFVPHGDRELDKPFLIAQPHALDLDVRPVLDEAFAPADEVQLA